MVPAARRHRGIGGHRELRDAVARNGCSPPVIAIQAALLVADQGQPFAVLTVIELAPAPAAMATFDVETS